VAPPVVETVEGVVAQWAAVRPDLDFSPITVFARLYLAGRLVERFYAKSVAPHGVAPGDFFVLCELRRAGPPWRLTPSALFKTLVRSSGGMTKQLDKLSAEGLITRVPDEADRRSLLVELTPRGLELVDRALTDHMANEKAILATLDPTETRTLAKSLQDMIDQLV
jgi:DNA-binding MarR family transcriptional regulator